MIVENPDLAQVAAVVGALGSALVLLGRNRAVLLAGLALLAAAEAGLVAGLSGTGQFDRLVSPAGAAAGAVGLVVLGAAAVLLARRPALVPLCVLATAPLRPPVSFDSSNRFLVSIAEDGRLGRLLPLYFVLLAAAVALTWRLLRGDALSGRRIPRTVALPAAAFFVFAFLSLLWADDLRAGANLLVYFTLPFAVLLATVSRADFPAWVPRALAVVAIALASLFALVGLWQAVTHKLFFFAPNLAVSNANTDYFRVTSLFGDPSLYGRHLVLGIGVVLSALALKRMDPWKGIAFLALVWAGLLFSYSQSSMVALVVIVLAIAAAAGDRRVRRAVAVTAAVGALAAGGYVAAKVASGDSLNHLTSDRTGRVEETARVIKEHPVIGVGIGGQPRASRDLAGSERPTPNFVSHTTPLTVAAELGAVGLALYAWLLVGGAQLISDLYRRHRPLALGLGAAFLALFVHALFYSGFLEDPLTWVVLAVAAGYLTGGPASATAGAARPAGEAAAAS